MPSSKPSRYYEPPLSQCPEPVAVVGIGCRLPGDVSSATSFWDLLISDRSGQTPKVPRERFNIDAYLHPNLDRPGSFNVPGGYFLSSDPRQFDPSFFGISPVEATWMDPQQRKMLEVVYETIEDAGKRLDEIAGSRTGVYVATFTADYQQLTTKEPDFRHSYAAIGIDPGILSARIAHFLDLRGPSSIANTACSSSLYALHSAVSALQTAEIEAAIVGGSNLILTVDQHMNTAKLGVLSPTSTCHTFDAAADGYGRAEGIGALYLKRLSDAMRDGDPIRAVIRSTATNTNGKIPGAIITHPSESGQEAVIRQAHKRGGNLNPLLCGYFECHGTGTPVGDPIEVRALSKAMNTSRIETEPPLLIGAVKPHIGHSEAASGVAAVIKAVLMVEKGLVPPVFGFKTPNPQIDFTGLRVKVAERLQSWPEHLGIRRVCVNSFGYGGTNGHCIVEGTSSVVPIVSNARPIPWQLATSTQNTRMVLPFSAHDRPTLLKNIAAHRAHFRSAAARGVFVDIKDYAHTLVENRSTFGYRGFASFAEGEDYIADVLREENIEHGQMSRDPPKVAFIFTGQGAQWPRMGAELLDRFPLFRTTITYLDKVLHSADPALDWHIPDALLEPTETSRVHRVSHSQPLCTAVQIGLVQLLASWAVHPSVTIGHSSGEIAAAFAAGLISAEEAILTAYFRGKVVSARKRKGAMVAVGLSASDVRSYLPEGNAVVVACENSPESVTLSGDAEVITSLAEVFKERSVFHRTLRTGDLAYHSPHMADYASEYETLLGTVDRSSFSTWAPQRVSMISSVDLLHQTKDSLSAAYWVRNLTQPVLFSPATGILLKTIAPTALVEIGPHSALAGPLRQILLAHQLSSIPYYPSLLRGQEAISQVFSLLGRMFMHGIDVNFNYPGSLLTDLPPYQWNYTKLLWGENRLGADSRALTHQRHDLLGSRVLGGVKSEPIWRNILRLKDLAWLSGHKLGSDTILAASAYIAMAIEALTQYHELNPSLPAIKTCTFRNVTFQKALVIPDTDAGVEVLLSSRYTEDGWLHYTISSVSSNVWTTHASGKITGKFRSQEVTEILPQTELTQTTHGERWYQLFSGIGFHYSGGFKGLGVARATHRAPFCVAETRLLRTVAKDESRYLIHPASMDMSLQVLLISICRGQSEDLKGFVPVAADQIIINLEGWDGEDSIGRTVSHVQYEGLRNRRSALQLIDHRGNVVVDMRGLQHTEYDGVASTDSSPDQPEADEKYWTEKIMPDVELVRGAELNGWFKSCQRENILNRLLELYAFKKPDLRILEFLDKTEKTHFHDLQKKWRHVSIETVNKNDAETLTTVDSQCSEYDLIIFPSTLDDELRQSLSNLIVRVKPTAHILVPTTPGLSVEPAGLKPRFTACSTISAYAPRPELLPLSSSSSDSGTGSDMDTSRPIVIIHTSAEEPPLVSSIRNVKKEVDFSVHGLAELPAATEGEEVVLLDLESPPILDPAVLTSSTFSALQKLLLSGASILWITNGGLANGRKRPEAAMAAGMVRSLRSEVQSARVKILDVDLDLQDNDDTAEKVWRVFENEGVDCEWLLSAEGWIGCQRLVPFQAREGSQVEIWGVPKAIRRGIKTEWEFNSAKLSDPSHGEVEVEVRSVGLNPELYVSSDETAFGFEFAGVVRRVGEGAKVKPGTSVMGLSPLSGARILSVREEFVFPIAEKDFAEASVAPLPLTNAVKILEMAAVANSPVCKTLVVFPSAGITGQLVIQLALSKGVSVYGVSPSAKLAFALIGKTHLPESRIIRPDACKGFDVAIMNEEDENLAEVWHSIATSGKLIALHTQHTGLLPSTLDTAPFRRGAQLLTHGFEDWYGNDPQDCSRAFHTAGELYTAGIISSPTISGTYTLDTLPSIQAAITPAWSSNRAAVVYPSLTSPTVSESSHELTFSSEASYLLVGCLGGIGRSLASFLVSHGARHLIFLSRSGSSSPNAQRLISWLQLHGVHTHVISGSISAPSTFSTLSSYLSSSPYQLKGIVNAAMVLNDSLFTSLNANSFTSTTSAKVAGTRALHTFSLNHPDLDFFITTSSISATLGTTGQANYAAANLYQDNLCALRRSQGLPATSLILPMVLGVGYIADRPEIEKGLERQGLYGIGERELERGFLHAFREQENIVVGFEPKRLAACTGEERIYARIRRLAHLNTAVDTAAPRQRTTNSIQNVGVRVRDAKSEDEARSIVEEEVKRKIARLLMREESEIETERTVAYYGLDSMIGTEFRNWIWREWGIEVGLGWVLDTSTRVRDVVAKVIQGVREDRGRMQ